MRHAKLFSLVMLLLLTIPNIVVADQRSDEEFLWQLAQTTQGIQSEPLDGIGTPAPTQMSCTIERNCGDGNTVSCVGTWECKFSTRGVSCNGVETACPAYCQMGWTCSECPSYSFWCHSLKGDCGVTAEGCDGRAQICRCPLTPEW